jgi:single-strand DNA-binding protein
MNQIVLMGRLTRDPELRHTQTGTAVSSFSLAVDRGFTSKDGGERQTDFIDIVAWRNTAEFVAKYFVKGQMAAVTGRLQIRDWTDKDGNKRRSAEVVADNVYFTDSKKSRESDGGGQSFSHQKNDLPGGYQTPVAGSDFAELEDDDGDLPF